MMGTIPIYTLMDTGEFPCRGGRKLEWEANFRSGSRKTPRDLTLNI